MEVLGMPKLNPFWKQGSENFLYMYNVLNSSVVRKVSATIARFCYCNQKTDSP